MDLIPGVAVSEIGAGALVVIVVLLILVGRLVPRQQLLDVQADRDHWRTAAGKLQEAALKDGMTLERLLSLAEASDHLLRELQAGAGRSEDP